MMFRIVSEKQISEAIEKAVREIMQKIMSDPFAGSDEYLSPQQFVAAKFTGLEELHRKLEEAHLAAELKKMAAEKMEHINGRCIPSNEGTGFAKGHDCCNKKLLEEILRNNIARGIRYCFLCGCQMEQTSRNPDGWRCPLCGAEHGRGEQYPERSE